MEKEGGRNETKDIVRSSRKHGCIGILWLVGSIITFAIFDSTINVFPWNLLFIGILIAGGTIIGRLQKRAMEREIMKKKERRKLGLSEEMD